MKITALVAQHITDIFEADNWTEVNIKNTLCDVDHIEATTHTKASPNTIAALLHHLSFYNDVVLMRLSGICPEIDDINGFNVPPIKNEQQWQQLKETVLDSARQLSEAVKNFPEEQIFMQTRSGHCTYYKMLQGIAEHAHYHLGQIIILKKLIRTRTPHLMVSNSL
ncbi:hypothetical protein BH11BAC6_BH11BAC6_16960 [soil metagenome]